MVFRRITLAVVALAAALGARVTRAAAPTIAGTSCDEHLPLSGNLTSFRFARGAVTTPSAVAKQLVDQAFMLCSAFNHDEGIRSLQAATKLDPDCSVCFALAAYANAPDINRNITAPRLAAAQAATASAQAALSRRPGVTALEKALVQASAVRFPASRTLANGWPLDVAYAKAMEAAADAQAGEADLQVLSAQAWMTTSAWNYYDRATGAPYDWVPGAIKRLELALQLVPGYPLAMHLHIHIVETRRFEPAVDAINATADRLRALIGDDALGIGHLLHMPAHVYLLVGRWEDATRENVRALALDRAYFALCPQALTQYPFYHALYFTHKHNFLLWTAGMEGKAALAVQTGRQQWGECHIDAATAIAPGQQARMPWLLQTMQRFGMWTEILSEPAPATEKQYVQSYWHHARTMALASTGDCAGAHAEAAKFHALQTDPSVRASVAFFNGGGLMDLANLTLTARMAQTCPSVGPKCPATAAMVLRDAVATEDSFGYNEPPLWPMSVRMCLGQALMDAGAPHEALEVYERDLQRRPNNGWALYGKWRALLASGDAKGAAAAQALYEAAWRNADTPLTSTCP